MCTNRTGILRVEKAGGTKIDIQSDNKTRVHEFSVK